MYGIVCPGCGDSMLLDVRHVGAEIRCPRCGAAFYQPAPPPAPLTEPVKPAAYYRPKRPARRNNDRLAAYVIFGGAILGAGVLGLAAMMLDEGRGERRPAAGGGAPRQAAASRGAEGPLASVARAVAGTDEKGLVRAWLRENLDNPEFEEIEWKFYPWSSRDDAVTAWLKCRTINRFGGKSLKVFRCDIEGGHVTYCTDAYPWPVD